VEAKVFDPMDERAVQAWLRSEPHKEIIAASVYRTRAGGVEHEVGIVLYVEERTVPEEEDKR
jgi:hypothetical protein